MSEPDDETYRPCVGIALFNKDGLVFIGRRHGFDAELLDHVWQMPQGGIDAGEAPLQAAKRELFEETSIRSVSLLGESRGWLTYDIPVDLTRKAWKGRFRGQKQKWFAFRFEGEDGEIDVAHPGGGGHKAEFEDWRWAPLEGVADLVVPFKRQVYDAVIAEFAPYAVPAKA